LQGFEKTIQPVVGLGIPSNHQQQYVIGTTVFSFPRAFWVFQLGDESLVGGFNPSENSQIGSFPQFEK